MSKLSLRVVCILGVSICSLCSGEALDTKLDTKSAPFLHDALRIGFASKSERTREEFLKNIISYYPRLRESASLPAILATIPDDLLQRNDAQKMVSEYYGWMKNNPPAEYRARTRFLSAQLDAMVRAKMFDKYSELKEDFVRLQPSDANMNLDWVNATERGLAGEYAKALVSLGGGPNVTDFDRWFSELQGLNRSHIIWALKFSNSLDVMKRLRSFMERESDEAMQAEFQKTLANMQLSPLRGRTPTERDAFIKILRDILPLAKTVEAKRTIQQLIE